MRATWAEAGDVRPPTGGGFGDLAFRFCFFFLGSQFGCFAEWSFVSFWDARWQWLVLGVRDRNDYSTAVIVGRGEMHSRRKCRTKRTLILLVGAIHVLGMLMF